MRALTLALALAAGPAAAWEFSPSPVCTLSTETPVGAVAVTYDPRAAQPYAIALTRSPPWPGGPIFGIRFEGGAPLTITTSRHRLSEGGATLTVTDRGFDNVLDGLEFNATATAFLGEATLALPLAGAAEEVQKFRACTGTPIV